MATRSKGRWGWVQRLAGARLVSCVRLGRRREKRSHKRSPAAASPHHERDRFAHQLPARVADGVRSLRACVLPTSVRLLGVGRIDLAATHAAARRPLQSTSVQPARAGADTHWHRRDRTSHASRSSRLAVNRPGLTSRCCRCGSSLAGRLRLVSPVPRPPHLTSASQPVAGLRREDVQESLLRRQEAEGQVQPRQPEVSVRPAGEGADHQQQQQGQDRRSAASHRRAHDLGRPACQYRNTHETNLHRAR